MIKKELTSNQQPCLVIQCMEGYRLVADGDRICVFCNGNGASAPAREAALLLEVPSPSEVPLPEVVSEVPVPSEVPVSSEVPAEEMQPKVPTALDDNLLKIYVTHPEDRLEWEQRFAAVINVRTLCRTVLWDFYNDVLLDCNNQGDKLLISTSFIKLLIPLLINVHKGKSVGNIRIAIHRHLLSHISV